MRFRLVLLGNVLALLAITAALSWGQGGSVMNPPRFTGALADGSALAPALFFASNAGSAFNCGIWKEASAIAFGNGASGSTCQILFRSNSNLLFSVGTGSGNINVTSAGQLLSVGHALASLGTPAVGTIDYCTDCTVATAPCTGAGSGTLAVRVNSGTPAWRCM